MGSTTHSPDESITAHPGSNVNKTVISISERLLTVIAIVIGVVALVTAFWSTHESALAERESRMLQYYVLEMDAKLIAAGVKKPEESVAKQLKEKKQ